MTTSVFNKKAVIAEWEGFTTSVPSIARYQRYRTMLDPKFLTYWGVGGGYQGSKHDFIADI